MMNQNFTCDMKDCISSDMMSVVDQALRIGYQLPAVFFPVTVLFRGKDCFSAVLFVLPFYLKSSHIGDIGFIFFFISTVY